MGEEGTWPELTQPLPRDVAMHRAAALMAGTLKVNRPDDTETFGRDAT